MEDIAQVIEVLQNVDKANPIEMSDDDSRAINTRWASPLTHDERSSLERLASGNDPATAALENIASSEDEDIASLAALMKGETYDNFG